jgi:signal transduction histidine kinase
MATRTSIVRHVILQIVVTMTVLLGGLGLIVYLVYQDQQRTEFENQSEIDIKQLSLALESPVWTFDRASIEELLKEQFKDSSTQAIYVDSELEYVNARRDASGHMVLVNDIAMPRMSNTFEKQAEIQSHGHVVGKLRIQFSTASIERELRSARIFAVIFVLALDLLVSAMLYLLLRKVVLLPLAVIGRYADNVAHHKKHVSIPTEVSFQGELEQLKTSIDDMVFQLHARNIELNETNATLDTRVQERTLQLSNSHAKLEAALADLKKAQTLLVQSEKLAALGSIVAAVAHELNTPLGNCLLVATTLQSSATRLHNDLQSGVIRRSQVNEYTALVQTGMEILVDGLRRASEQVANFKQIAVDQTSELRREFDLKEVADGVAKLVQSMLHRTQAKLTVDIPSGLILDSYPGALEQVFSNLVNNSVVHGFEARNGQGKMNLSSRTEGDGVLIEFKDDGVGMPESTIARIFDPFFTTKFGKGGSGLGMSICYNLVTGVLGGSIAVQSELGVGTITKIHIPFTAPWRRVKAEDSTSQ